MVMVRARLRPSPAAGAAVHLGSPVGAPCATGHERGPACDRQRGPPRVPPPMETTSNRSWHPMERRRGGLLATEIETLRSVRRLRFSSRARQPGAGDDEGSYQYRSTNCKDGQPQGLISVIFRPCWLTWTSEARQWQLARPPPRSGRARRRPVPPIAAGHGAGDRPIRPQQRVLQLSSGGWVRLRSPRPTSTGRQATPCLRGADDRSLSLLVAGRDVLPLDPQ